MPSTNAGSSPKRSTVLWPPFPAVSSARVPRRERDHQGAAGEEPRAPRVPLPERAHLLGAAPPGLGGVLGEAAARGGPLARIGEHPVLVGLGVEVHPRRAAALGH